MLSKIALAGVVAANPMGSNYLPPQQVPIYQAAPAAPAAPAMDPMMMMLLMKDDDSSMSDILPLMMMSGGMGGGAGGMNPLLMMSLFEDDCKAESDALKTLQGSIVDQDLLNELGAGDKFFVGADVTNVQSADIVSSVSSNVAQAAIAMQFIDYDYIKCEAGGSGMSDLLPLMMMGGGLGGAGGMGGMDPMMMMMLMDDGDMGDLLPLMMMGGGLGGAGGMGGMDPMMMMLMMDGGDMKDLLPLMMMGGGMGGAEGGMNPMMMMMLLDSDDDDADDDSCLKEFGIEHVFINTAGTIAKSTADADIIDFFKTGSFTSGVAKDFNECLADPTDYDFGSGLSDLLPLMMMGGNGGQMDPMMMMLLMKDL